MTTQSPDEHHIDAVREYFADGLSWSYLLLLRGLFVGGILRYVFKDRRWRVDYGLDLSRTLLAVPYRAKDMPALRAEFSHPDVAILLTCLSYSYGGLSEGQLQTCFDLLYKTDNPDLEYETWIHDCKSDLPPSLRNLSGVNIRSSQQWHQLQRIFNRNNTVIYFFLSHVVFPREAKQFPKKIATSSWDIAEVKTHGHITTGFSGTNDNKYLLPLSIHQEDPKHQLGTNAKVLSYLLREENNLYIPAIYPNGQRLSAEGYIEKIVLQKPEVRAILDVGAQMLEVQNEEFATLWLVRLKYAEGVIFFTKDDELVIKTRSGKVEKFMSSPLSQKLDKCLLYLDDAHTRGTDIKLPRGFRAAVTLGPKVTKDRLTQGCMRLRRLGNGHTVLFMAPPEVDLKIRQAANKMGSNDRVEVSDILRWTMQETCSQIQYYAPQWVEQGIDYQQRSEAWKSHIINKISPEALGSSWVSQEARSLEELYSPSTVRHVDNLERHPKLRERCQQLGITAASTGLDEEEEREVAHEIERERQIQRPPPATSAKPSVHKDVLYFVSSGLIREGSLAFAPAFSTFGKLLSSFEDNIWSANIKITKDFAVTIAPVSRAYDNAEEFHNVINWIMSSMKTGGLVIISPHEANELLPKIRESKAVQLHVYTPRVLREMKPGDLTFYCVPPLPQFWVPPPQSLINRMNILCGQLYFNDFESYEQTCNFLGLYTKKLDEFGEFKVQSNGFIAPENRRGQIHSQFKQDQLPFLQRLITIRRKGVEFARSHVGKLTDGKLLTEKDF